MLRYDPDQSYEWNYEHAPDESQFALPSSREPSAMGRSWDFCGLPVSSPLGIPAGPLLNGRWVLYYSHLGFDVLTYKTVRSKERECYPLPNLQPVRVAALDGSQQVVDATHRMLGSWAISFGMPSRAPEVWRKDVEWTRNRLPKGKLLCVSVVGTMQPGWKLTDLASDYARCARWAVESGAHCVEANLSCPNVLSQDGQLYHQPEAAAWVASAVKFAAGKAPVLLKIGHISREEDAEAFAAAVFPFVQGLSMVNCLAACVQDEHRGALFDNQPRGIGGSAIREASIQQVSLFARLIRERRLNLDLVGVGGISTASDVRRYLTAGAQAVQLATAAMLNPRIGQTIRRDLLGQTWGGGGAAGSAAASAGISKDLNA